MLKRAVIPIYRRLAHKATCILVNSLRNAAGSRDLPPRAAPFIEVPWGVDPAPYQIDGTLRAELTAERRRRFGDAPVIGFVGRFVRYKGLPILVDAMARLDGAHALLIGDGPLRAGIAEKIRAAGLGERVHLLGDVDEAAKIRAMAMMDLLAFPSIETTEAFGLAQVEAQMMGLPVVASNLPTGVIDVTLDNVTGLLVCAARERALRLFALSVFEERIARVLDTVLSGQALGALTNSVFAEPDRMMALAP
jgi:rhamnosyl/mannosyltransferase